ncbi:neuromedin-B receptor-like [Lineus longissimus]|uniref:neuromedin-B receptor-like n=1 Tax=Lineus longissimus TaxID=88925 RepID=UPI00315C50BD
MNINITMDYTSDNVSLLNETNLNGTHGTNGSLVDSDQQQQVMEIPLYLWLIPTAFYIFIFTCGVTGNSLVVIVICKNKDMRNTTNYFLTNLAIADLLVLVVCMPTALMEIYTKEIWYLGEIACKALPSIENCVANASVLTLLAISKERYDAVCRPFMTYQRERSGNAGAQLRQTIYLLCGIWLIALLAALPFSFIARLIEERYYDGSIVPRCSMAINNDLKKSYAVGVFAAFYAIPFIILFVVYAVICKSILFRAGYRTCTQDRTRSSRAVAFMLLTLVALFFTSHMPYRVISTMIIFRANYVYRLGFEGYYNVIYMSRIMFYLNSCMNPIIYNFMSNGFHEAFKSSICVCLRKKREPRENGHHPIPGSEGNSRLEQTFGEATHVTMLEMESNANEA